MKVWKRVHGWFRAHERDRAPHESRSEIDLSHSRDAASSQHARDADDAALRELHASIQLLVHRNPDARRVISALAAWLHTIAANPVADSHRVNLAQSGESEVEVEVEVEVVGDVVANGAVSTDENHAPSSAPLVESTISVTPFSASCNASELELPSSLARATSSVESKPIPPTDTASRDDADDDLFDTALGDDAPTFTPEDPAALEASKRALLDRWGNPDVSPKAAMESRFVRITEKVAPSNPDSELANIRHRLCQHLKALDWAHACAQTSFAKTKPEYDRLCELGKREEIFFWELQALFRPDSPETWVALRGRYSAVEQAIQLYLEEPVSRFRTAEVFRIVADAVAHLGKAMKKLDNTGFRDTDVEALVHYCRHHPRHGSPPSPLGTKFVLAHFLERIAKVRNGIREAIARDAAPRKALQKLKYHLRLIAENPSDAESHAAPMLVAIRAFVAAGKSLTDPTLRTSFNCLESLAQVPESVRTDPVGAELMAILQKPMTSPVAEEDEEEDEDDEDDETAKRPPTQEVLAVREVLRGKRMVLIGGDEKIDSARRIVEAFELADLDWIETKPNGAHRPFTPPIRDPDTTVVVLMIRWSRHQFGDVRDICEEFDKPFARLKSGYNPNNMARALIDQVSTRLGIVPL